MAMLLFGSQLNQSAELLGPLEHESTNQIQGISPGPLRVRPEPRGLGELIAVPLSLTVYPHWSPG